MQKSAKKLALAYPDFNPLAKTVEIGHSHAP
jgi:hypothetical protein